MGIGRAPVALAADAPVAQPPGAPSSRPGRAGREVVRRWRPPRRRSARPLVGAGVDHARRAPCRRTTSCQRVVVVAASTVDLRPPARIGRPYFSAKAKSRSSCAGHAHHGAVAVAHQHVVAHPHVGTASPVSGCVTLQAGRARPSSPASRVRPRWCRRPCTPRRRRRPRAWCAPRARASGCSAATAQKVTPMIVSARVVKTYRRPPCTGAPDVVADLVREGEAHAFAACRSSCACISCTRSGQPGRRCCDVLASSSSAYCVMLQVVARDLALLHHARRCASRGRRSPARWPAPSGPPGPS
jgi:hypothetical protein